MEGIIFNIKRFTIHDGPGLRTTVFFKGCPLQCWWCHNPESKKQEIESFLSIEKIGDSAFECSREIGRKVTVDEVMAEIHKERVFMEEGKGGITLSGGEPLMQPQFAKEILSRCISLGIHTVLDTSGFANEETFQSIIPLTNTFLFDIKLINNDKHRAYTGVDNLLILNNLKNAAKAKAKIIGRIPVIPEINMNQPDMEDILNTIKPLQSKTFDEIHLLPYHYFGQSKYQRFNKTNQMNNIPEPTKKELEPYAILFRNEGFNVRVH